MRAFPFTTLALDTLSAPSAELASRPCVSPASQPIMSDSVTRKSLVLREAGRAEGRGERLSELTEGGCLRVFPTIRSEWDADNQFGDSLILQHLA